jgi:hypothetical protein
VLTAQELHTQDWPVLAALDEAGKGRLGAGGRHRSPVRKAWIVVYLSKLSLLPIEKLREQLADALAGAHGATVESHPLDSRFNRFAAVSTNGVRQDE